MMILVNCKKNGSTLIMTTLITTFLIILAISFSLMLSTAALISYCKRRQNRTPHGLTGMCHQTGGTMCGTCSSQLHDTIPKKLV